ncbi:MAG: hypothetical protein ACK5AQ_11410, partial [Bacteroidota bacterium]
MSCQNKVLFFLFFWWFIPFGLLLAQTPKTFRLEFDATVREKKNAFKLPDTKIEVLRDGVLVETLLTDASGRHIFKFQPNGEYELRFSKAGYVTKTVSVSTNDVPEKDLVIKLEIFTFKVNVDLFPRLPDIDFSILDQPVGKIYYNKKKKDFDYDEEYTKSIQKELLAVITEIERRQKEEEEKLKAELSEKEKAEKEEKARLAEKAREEARLKLEMEAKARAEAEEAERKRKEAELKARIEAANQAKAEEESKKK